MLTGWRWVDRWRWRRKAFRRATASRRPSPASSPPSPLPIAPARRRGRCANPHYLSLHPHLDSSLRTSSKLLRPTPNDRRCPATASTHRPTTPTPTPSTRLPMRSRCPPENTSPRSRRSALPLAASRRAQLPDTVSRATWWLLAAAYRQNRPPFGDIRSDNDRVIGYWTIDVCKRKASVTLYMLYWLCHSGKRGRCCFSVYPSVQ